MRLYPFSSWKEAIDCVNPYSQMTNCVSHEPSQRGDDGVNATILALKPIALLLYIVDKNRLRPGIPGSSWRTISLFTASMWLLNVEHAAGRLVGQVLADYASARELDLLVMGRDARPPGPCHHRPRPRRPRAWAFCCPVPWKVLPFGFSGCALRPVGVLGADGLSRLGSTN